MIFIQNGRKVEGSTVIIAIDLYSNKSVDKVLYVNIRAKVKKCGLGDVIGCITHSWLIGCMITLLHWDWNMSHTFWASHILRGRLTMRVYVQSDATSMVKDLKSSLVMADGTETIDRDQKTQKG